LSPTTSSLLWAVALATISLSACAAPKPEAPVSIGTAQSAMAAVSGGSAVSAATPAGAVDSCVAVTQSEAAAALGQSVRAPVRGKATVEGGIACVFYAPSVPPGADPDIPVNNSVRVVLVRGSDAARFFNDYRGRVRPVPVTGLGDQAYFDGTASLSVLKGDSYLRVAVIGVTDVLSAEKKLAAAALPRM
jgi:hypothetical protein